MKNRAIVFAALVGLALAGSASAADEYTIDTAHSGVGFSVRHMVISKVKGELTDFSGTIVYDPSNLDASSVAVTMKANSISTHNTDRDKHLQSEDFLAADTYPDITFRSLKVEKRGNGLVAIGDLTIRDVTKKIELPFTITGIITDPWGNTRMGVEVEPVTIDRTDFGVSWSKVLDNGGLVVSDEVVLDLALEAVKKKDQE